MPNSRIIRDFFLWQGVYYSFEVAFGRGLCGVKLRRELARIVCKEFFGVLLGILN